MKSYEKIAKTISKAALQQISQVLCYLTDKVSILSLFDEDVDKETKFKTGQNLTKEEEITHGKRYIPSKEKLCGSLCSISERIAVLNMRLPGYKHKWLIIQVYAPTEQQDERVKDIFYDQLSSVLQDAHKNITVIGDFNGRIGSQRTGEEKIIERNTRHLTINLDNDNMDKDIPVFLQSEIEKAVNSQKNNKAPGPDQIRLKSEIK
ncbi:hypothetical protein EVAR_53042_1 [Eumeta japonica]|uniref:Craniofacial development protein 2 n=1 Tax=Eumeta variegata TaxID=151549 RepID=A0A4C1YSD2_EUMVA|nr:hypothetical protein EVAR_53042_1 [Eumeta japonica]